MTQPTTARRAATRERLVTAAIHVIAAKGVLGSSVEEICEAAGFTRGAFYSNFDSKDELCAAILDHTGARYVAAAQEALGHLEVDLPVDEIARQAIGMFAGSIDVDADTVLVMSELRLYATREPAFREAFRRFDASMEPVFGGIIDEGLRAAHLRLTVGMGDMLSLLHAVYDQTALDQLVQGLPPNSPTAASRLEVVLRAFVVADD